MAKRIRCGSAKAGADDGELGWWKSICHSTAYSINTYLKEALSLSCCVWVEGSTFITFDFGRMLNNCIVLPKAVGK